MKRIISKIGALTLGRAIIVGILLTIVTLMVLLYPQIHNAISAQDKSSNQSPLGIVQEPLRVDRTNPQNGATGVQDDITIEITFNNPLTPPPPPPPPTTTTTQPPTTTTTEQPTTTTEQPTTTTEQPTTTTEEPTTEQPTTTTEQPTTTTEQPTTTEQTTTTTETSPTITRVIEEGIKLEPAAGRLLIIETDHTLIINPSQDLKPGTTYTLTIEAGAVQDSAGDTLDHDFVLTFTTQHLVDTPPTVKSTNPKDGETGVPITKTIEVTLSEDVRPGSTFNNITVEDPHGNPIRIDRSVSKNVLFINPVNNLAFNTRYTVRIPAGAVKDNLNLELRSPHTFSFRTQTAPPPPLTVVSTNPKDGEKNVPITKTIEVTFSKDIQAGRLFNGISLEDANGNPIRVDRTISGRKLFINPVNNLAFNVLYIFTIPADSVQDLEGNNLRSRRVFSFRTQAAPDTTPPVVVSTNPKSGETGVARDKTIAVVFNEDIRTGPNFANIVLQDEAGNPVGIVESISGRTLFIDPIANLAFNTLYTVNIPIAAVQDLSGNSLAAPYMFSFRTQVAPPPPPPPTCPDVPAGAWYKPFMDRLVQARIIEGFPPNGECRPLSNVTRAEFTKMVILAIGESPSNAPSSFSDVPNDYWARGFIQRARELGIATGFTDGTYRPDEPITREEIVIMVVRAGKFPTATTFRAVFPDVPSTLGSWPFILAARDLGIVVGYPNGTFRPKNFATRAEAAKVISLMMDLMR